MPEEDAKRRYKRGLERFWNIYRLLADYVTIIVNNEYYDFKRIAHGESDKIEIINKKLYDMFLEQIKEIKNGS